jgi:2-dehydro-3-deoxyphosphogluconate aldolase/(4S)-4-hydroxy-2-oxoglutarate aldolase
MFSTAAPAAEPIRSRFRSFPDRAMNGDEPLRRRTMAKDRMAVLTALMDQGVIPVFFHPDLQTCLGVIQACADAGARCFEFTNRGEGAAQVFAEAARHFARADPGVILGAGSVVDPATAALFIANGARFVVSPLLNPEVAKVCNRQKIAYSPGCATPSEINQAEELGCEIVKFFPGGAAGGPEFVKAILGPMPWTRLMPTGGVETDEVSLKAWFDAGVVAVGAGGGLIPKALVAAGDFKAIEAHVRRILELARRVRGRA